MAAGDLERIVSSDKQREDEVLLPFMQDPRIGLIILSETIPGLGIKSDAEAIIEEVAAEYKVNQEIVREAIERGKNKFERIQEQGY